MFNTPFTFMAAPAGGTLLLDVYTGSKRAYSVRKLSSSYTGDAIRVRRSSDNAEQNIGFVGEDLDTSALTTFVGANDGFITTWYDQSGNGANATQSTAATQATIVSAGTIYTAGTKSAIYASSGRSFMQFTAFTTTLVSNLLVGKKASATSDYMIGIGGTKPGGAAPMLSHWTDSNIYFQWLTKYSVPNSSIANINYETIFAATTSASTSVIYRNGSSLALSNNTDNSINNNYSQMFKYTEDAPQCNAYFQELIVWDFDQSANASGIDSNVNTYYSIY